MCNSNLCYNFVRSADGSVCVWNTDQEAPCPQLHCFDLSNNSSSLSSSCGDSKVDCPSAVAWDSMYHQQLIAGCASGRISSFDTETSQQVQSTNLRFTKIEKMFNFSIENVSKSFIL